MRVAAFIPARGGSERIPRKNLCRVGEHTLLERAIGVAMLAGLSPVVVSTEDQGIADVARAAGAVVHDRPPHMASGTAPIEDALLHWLARSDAEAVVLLQPTSPLRTAATIKECVRMLELSDADSVLTVTIDSQRATFVGRPKHVAADESREGGLAVRWDRPAEHRPRTQDGLEAVENGCVYVTRRAHLLVAKNRMGGRELCYPIDKLEAWDVDTPTDLLIANAILSWAMARAASAAGTHPGEE